MPSVGTPSFLNVQDVIDGITGQPIDVDSYEFAQLRSKVRDNVRSFKNKTIERFVVHIGDLLKHEPWL